MLRKAFDGETYYWYEDGKSRQAKSRVVEVGCITQETDKAPEHVFLKACHPASPNHNCTWSVSKDQKDSVEYIRADLLATVRREEQANFVNNVAAILDADDVEAFTALIMKAKASPDLNSETRSALRSEAEIRREAFKEAVALVQSVTNENDLDDGGFFEAGFIAARTKSIDALIAASATEKGKMNG